MIDYDDYENTLIESDFDDYEYYPNGYSEEGESSWFNPNYYDNINGVMIEKRKDETQAKHYVRLGTTKYGFVDDVVEQIQAGFYRPEWDAYNQKALLEKREVVLPKLYHLPNDIFEMLINDITHFWESEERYKAFGNVYKRNILLYSIPGNGKTSVINMLAFELIEKYNGLIITINSVDDLRAYPKCIEKIRMIEPKRNIITIIEDFDALISLDKTNETLLLQLLDGNNQYDNMVTIATTNHIDKLEKSFTNRPSRFNLILEYKKPDEKTRRFYFTNKLNDSGVDVSKQENIDAIERYVNISDGFTFDYCKELLQMIYVDELSEEDAFNRIKTIVDKKGEYKITEEDRTTVGFDIPKPENIQTRGIGFAL